MSADSTAELLDRRAADDWARAGTHREEGANPLLRWLAFPATHTDERAARSRQRRLARVGAASPPTEPSSARAFAAR